MPHRLRLIKDPHRVNSHTSSSGWSQSVCKLSESSWLGRWPQASGGLIGRPFPLMNPDVPVRGEPGETGASTRIKVKFFVQIRENTDSIKLD